MSSPGPVARPDVVSAPGFPAGSPLPLSASQEAQVREIYHRNVRRKCADEIREFAACALDRTFTASILCRQERRVMNACMLQYAHQGEHDAARAEWFATREQRREEREAKEAKRREQEKFHLEWWAREGDKGQKKA